MQAPVQRHQGFRGYLPEIIYRHFLTISPQGAADFDRRQRRIAIAVAGWLVAKGHDAMQAGSMTDIYACVAEYRLDTDDAEARAGAKRLFVAPARFLWLLLSGFLFGKLA